MHQGAPRLHLPGLQVPARPPSPPVPCTSPSTRVWGQLSAEPSPCPQFLWLGRQTTQESVQSDVTSRAVKVDLVQKWPREGHGGFSLAMG